MPRVRVLIAAAGRGTRAGLPYPKTLFPIKGLPILIRILRLLQPYDDSPTVIVSPDGKDAIEKCLIEHELSATLVTQPAATGMGNAVLRFQQSPAYTDADHVLLIWGDIPFIQSSTVDTVVRRHLAQGNDFTFPTRVVGSAYTVVTRDPGGFVVGVDETRELGVTLPSPGERDVGLFAFRPAPVFEVLQSDLPGKFGKATGEHGFLYVVRHLVARGCRVEAMPVATELDLVSLNSLKDVHDYL